MGSQYAVSFSASHLTWRDALADDIQYTVALHASSVQHIRILAGSAL